MSSLVEIASLKLEGISVLDGLWQQFGKLFRLPTYIPVASPASLLSCAFHWQQISRALKHVLDWFQAASRVLQFGSVDSWCRVSLTFVECMCRHMSLLGHCRTWRA